MILYDIGSSWEAPTSFGKGDVFSLNNELHIWVEQIEQTVPKTFLIE